MPRIQRADINDLLRSVETNGTPTDVYRLMASKALRVPYQAVTEQQRQAAKSATYHLRYR